MKRSTSFAPRHFGRGTAGFILAPKPLKPNAECEIYALLSRGDTPTVYGHREVIWWTWRFRFRVLADSLYPMQRGKAF